MFRKLGKKQNRNQQIILHDYKDFIYEKVNLPKEFPTNPRQLLDYLSKVYKDSDDFGYRMIHIPSGQEVLICYFEGLVDNPSIEEKVIYPFMKRTEQKIEDRVTSINNILYSFQITELSNWEQMIQECCKGKIIIHVEGLHPITVDLALKERRGFENPSTEQQIYGPKLGFIEHLQTNISLLRKCLPDPRLKMKRQSVGSLSHTNIAIMYIDEYADQSVVDDIEKKIKAIDIDYYLTSRILVQQIVDKPKSIFPQAEKTERPDRAAYALTQGKVVILLDNMTFVNIAPTTLFSFYEVGEDNNEGSTWNMLFLKFLRLVCLIVSTIFPALYVSLVAFHPELIPTTLALTVAESRNNIPFIAPIEALIMMFALDVLIESSIRMPNYIGQTVAIVGGLVIGTAAVDAGIVSSAMVIVIAFTAIASFTVPSYELASSWRIVRYGLLIIASLFGLFGLTIGICIVAMHLASLESFGKPYLSPLAPFNGKEILDMIIRKSLNDNKQGGKQSEG